jgi:hypothetical protein
MQSPPPPMEYLALPSNCTSIFTVGICERKYKLITHTHKSALTRQRTRVGIDNDDKRRDPILLKIYIDEWEATLRKFQQADLEVMSALNNDAQDQD